MALGQLAGRRSSLTTIAGSTDYTYDDASQLLSASPPVGPTETFTYDAAGNRTSTATAPLGSFTFDSGDRLTADATSTYAYTPDGDLASRTLESNGATTGYTWSAEHRLTHIAYADGTSADLRYDPLGRLVEMDKGSTVTRYAYDHDQLVAEYDGANTLVATYVHDLATPARTLEMTRNGQRYFYLTDAQNSTAALTTLTGTVAARYTYSAFGAPTETGAVSNPLTYTGQRYDAKSGLFLFPLRAYDPALGRFLSEDPKPCVNPYPYVSNNPPNRTDPSGAGEGEHPCGEYEPPWPWEVFEALHAVAEAKELYEGAEAALEGAHAPAGTEYLATVIAVGANYATQKVLAHYVEQVATIGYDAACALRGVPQVEPGE